MRCSKNSAVPAKLGLFSIAAAILVLAFTPAPAARATATGKDLPGDLGFFGSMRDRSPGTKGAEAAAGYIIKAFEEAGLTGVESQEFLMPVPEASSASISVAGEEVRLYPWGPNLVYLPNTPKEGLNGPLLYAADGRFDRFDGKPVQGGIVLMEMASRGNWINGAALGASAVVFLGSKDSASGEFTEKNTPTPLAFPRFWAPPEAAEKLKRLAATGSQATLKSKAGWRTGIGRNCYGLVAGKSDALKNELIVIEASYDASSHILGLAPGADEAVSVSVLLTLARQFAGDPLDRSVLFVATAGNGQGLAGMRHFVSAFSGSKKALKKERDRLEKAEALSKNRLDAIQKENPLGLKDPAERDLVLQVMVEAAKDKADALSRQMRLEGGNGGQAGALSAEAESRMYRHISWVTSLDELTPEQRVAAGKLLEDAAAGLKAEAGELKLRRKAIKSGKTVKDTIEDFQPVLFLSLNLSSHSRGIGLIETGDTYPIRESLRRTVRAGRLDLILGQAGAETASQIGLPNLVGAAGGAPGAEDDWEKGYKRFGPNGDAAVIAGLPAATLATLDDRRPLWSTPGDTIESVDPVTAQMLHRFLPPLIRKAAANPHLRSAVQSGPAGFAALSGQAMFIRQGELFPDQPAAGTIISVMQGSSLFRTVVFRDGFFMLPGLASSRVAPEKAILEPYGVDPETGRVAYAADKVRTGKENYRVSVKSDSAAASLVMFRCLQTDVTPVLNPATLGYLTKVELLDAVTQTTPLRYWYSRIDGRDTMALSVFLEQGTRFKLIMSESLLGKDLLLLNSSPENPFGAGFLIGEPAAVPMAHLQAANDLHQLLGGRLRNLTAHGIANRTLDTTYETAGNELARSRTELAAKNYGRSWDDAVSAWARLNVVYSEIENNQRDVLGGVMFFIALFVPFAYCMERYLFAFRSIYQQLAAFFVILVATILLIRALHPAFQLTYNPMVVILAFFIVGLSLVVSWIIFMRFEREIAGGSELGAAGSSPQVSKWQAFGAGFAIGVSNLNRRKLRTALTCLTLVILTFTVMSFTNVRSLYRTTRARIADSAPYEGILIRHQYRLALNPMLLSDMESRFANRGESKEGAGSGKYAGGAARPGRGGVWAKAWVSPAGPADRILARVSVTDGSAPVEGILGLGADPPAYFKRIIASGRWFEEGAENSVLLPIEMAKRLGLDPEKGPGATVDLMGSPFRVAGYFDGPALESLKDLDSNPILPAYFEAGFGEEASEAELEAMQAGEEVLPQSERFRYASANRTVLIPLKECLQLGGELKAISVIPASNPDETAENLSSWLAYPLFVGDAEGAWYQSASTALRYQGAANLIVPILIVIFITLNTMIGHVHERQREIGTYTSVGLAPVHVGFLFIVEALALAVISTVIGYILAQVSAHLLAGTALFASLTFNYSSLASVACMVLVFSVVFAASLYPARVAAAIAMPDVNRTWSLPAPDGDEIYMNLPFLLKGEEEEGIMRFLGCFFESHEDIVQGSFIVDGTSLDLDIPPVRPGWQQLPACLLIRANGWLAPFDFGIKQRISVHCCPSYQDPGYLEIAIEMTRLSGERSAWVRANRGFVKDVRKQMLLWRLLPPERKSVFFKTGMTCAEVVQIAEPEAESC